MGWFLVLGLFHYETLHLAHQPVIVELGVLMPEGQRLLV